MAEDYSPPQSPNVNLVFSGISYSPPASPDVNLIFGDGENQNQNGLLLGNYTILLTM